MSREEKQTLNFIEQLIEKDLSNGLEVCDLRFRFPPEPNGYLHIGHAKAIGINFGLGKKYGAPVNLRFDDTNPVSEEAQYVQAIKKDIQWLGFKWDKQCYASDYFEQLYKWAEQLIRLGFAYVDSQSTQEINKNQKKPSERAIESPFRERSVEENLDLFRGMRAGKYHQGQHVLRAKLDMTSPNMHMRDPIMYRILKQEHHRTGNKWCIYPLYDWAHGQSDYLEQVSHSLCSLEFIHHRPLYDWFIDHLHENHLIRNKQYEFARGNVEYMVTSKRKLIHLIEKHYVTGWDDPRMPTISGMRRRGYTPESINQFWESVGVSKRDNVIDLSLLEHSIRNNLNTIVDRLMVVLNPVKLTITNYPENKHEWLFAENNPEDQSAGMRKIPFGRELYIERDDFKESANRKFFRLALGKEVRLKNAYIIKGVNVIKDDLGNIIEIQCTYDPDSKSGSESGASKRKVKGTLHWVLISKSVQIEVRLYDRLFLDPTPDSHQGKEFTEFINPNSLVSVQGFGEPEIENKKQGDRVQFQRLGYFCKDRELSKEKSVWNRTVSLRETWAKKGN